MSSAQRWREFVVFLRRGPDSRMASELRYPLPTMLAILLGTQLVDLQFHAASRLGFAAADLAVMASAGARGVPASPGSRRACRVPRLGAARGKPWRRVPKKLMIQSQFGGIPSLMIRRGCWPVHFASWQLPPRGSAACARGNSSTRRTQADAAARRVPPTAGPGRSRPHLA